MYFFSGLSGIIFPGDTPKNTSFTGKWIHSRNQEANFLQLKVSQHSNSNISAYSVRLDLYLKSHDSRIAIFPCAV